MYKLISVFIAMFLGMGTFWGNIESEEEVLIYSSNNENLKRFESEEELKDMIDKYYQDQKMLYVNDDYVIRESSDLLVFNDVASAVTESESTSKGYSDTNVQVVGVDEADIVKTNGEYIYYLTENKLVIVKATPADKMNIVKTINSLDDNESYYAREIYIDDKYMTIIGTKHIESKNEETIDEINAKRYYYPIGETVSVIKVYDINTYNQVREFEVSGNYISSRKIDDDIYLISNKYVYNNNIIIPRYRDTLISEVYCNIDAREIYYFPAFEECSYMIVASLSLDNIDEEANIETFLGAGNQVYASTNSLYISAIAYKENEEKIEENLNAIKIVGNNSNVVTRTHKFEIENGNVKYIATGEVTGSLLNQFSMDEYNGYFRITTTDNTDWENSTNNLYVLDNNMDIVGKIEGLAEGERIYSTRFMGDKCYMVTYKTVDPLFVIDLSIPTNPKVLGELKIPGYSSYLHPLGENYLIGFGEDSVEKSYINWKGETEVTAYATGLKLAIFDITDFSNPKELHSVKIGGRGSWSELLNNHKALLFDEEKDIFAFPAEVCTEGGFYDNGIPEYGELEFSGALIFDLSVENGIKLRGKIEHEESKEYYNTIERIIYIGDCLYTLSNEMIKANDINTLKEISSVTIENTLIRK